MDTDERAAITFPEALRQIFGAPFRLRTYKNLLYLTLAMPLGLAYFVFLIVGLALGFGLTLIWIGLPLLALVFAATLQIATQEAVKVPAHIADRDRAPHQQCGKSEREKTPIHRRLPPSS